MTRLMSRALVTAWVVILGAATFNLLNTPAQADLEGSPTKPRPASWTPPSWHPNPGPLAVLPELDRRAAPTTGAPKLYSRAVFAFDVDSGEVLYERAADDRRPVASLTKLVSSLAMASESPDLDRDFCIDVRFRPTRNGAFSKLSTGECYRAWDLLGSALVSSDNRGAYGMQVASGLPYDDFIHRMDEVSADLHMAMSTWADPSGLEDENLSTARDMARAALAVAAHPVLSIPATAEHWDIERTDAKRDRRLYSTNRLAGRKDLEILAAKTGYTDTAGYCFAGVFVTPSGRQIALSVLGAGKNEWRWRDVEALLRWADEG